MLAKYILVDRQPVLEPDLTTWARWFEKADRHVAQTTVGNSRVSTVFLCHDHRFSGDGPPILFETMVFSGPLDDEQERYCTWEDAKKGHAAMVARVRQANNGETKKGVSA